MTTSKIPFFKCCNLKCFLESNICVRCSKLRQCTLCWQSWVGLVWRDMETSTQKWWSAVLPGVFLWTRYLFEAVLLWYRRCCFCSWRAVAEVLQLMFHHRKRCNILFFFSAFSVLAVIFNNDLHIRKWIDESTYSTFLLVFALEGFF